MNQGLEDLLKQARNTGAARDEEMACFFYDFDATPTSGSIGAKKTRLVLPAHTIVESGLLYSASATTGAFNLQLVAASDLLASQSALAIDTMVNVNRLSLQSEKEVTINVTAAATGKVLVWLRLYPTVIYNSVVSSVPAVP